MYSLPRMSPAEHAGLSQEDPILALSWTCGVLGCCCKVCRGWARSRCGRRPGAIIDSPSQRQSQPSLTKIQR